MVKENKAKDLTQTSIYTIFEYLYRFLFILMVPFLKQVLLAIVNPKEITNLITLSSISAVSIIFLAYLSYLKKQYLFQNNVLEFRKGVLLKHSSFLKSERLKTILLRKTVGTSFFSSSKIFIGTLANVKYKTEISLTLKNPSIKNFYNFFFTKQKISKVYKAKFHRIFLISLLYSNPIRGIIFFLPFLDRLGNLIGNQSRNYFYKTLDLGLGLISLNVKPATFVLIRTILVGCSIAFILSVVKNLKLKSYWTDNEIYISSGLINKNEIVIKKNSVNALIIRQNAFMKIFKIYNVYLNAVSHKKARLDRNPILIGCTKKEIKKILPIFSHFFVQSNNKISMPKFSKWWFFLNPISVLFLSIVVFIFILKIDKQQILIIPAVFLFFACLCFFIVKISAFKTSGISSSSNFLFINSYSLFSNYMVLTELKKVSLYKINKNALFPKSKTCELQIFIYSQNKKQFKIKNLPINNLSKFLSYAF
ncbi:MAG: PH domain-containing protein [Oscillospiraceae bacterium]|nr:PH domain-containing protein [Oscillospiraceae bacterium]